MALRFLASRAALRGCTAACLRLSGTGGSGGALVSRAGEADLQPQGSPSSLFGFCWVRQPVPAGNTCFSGLRVASTAVQKARDAGVPEKGILDLVAELKEAADALAPPELGPPLTVPIINFAREEVGQMELPADIFKQEIRRDILHRVVRWQRASWQQGTHSTKTRGEVRGGGKKPFPQKKTGNARAGSIRSPLWRGGGIIHGPKPRSHAHGLQKKVRRLGLKVALSAKASEGRLIILDSMAVDGKTKTMANNLASLLQDAPRQSILLVDSGKEAADGGERLRRAVGNIPWVDTLPHEGANVYSILQRDYLALTPGATYALIKRLRQPIKR